jgi:exodeoxyribonuclease VII small subunit
MSKTKSDKPLRFEEAIAQLEAIIDRIESGEVGLEECLTQYEQGMNLIKYCRGVLSKAEQKIAELAPDAKGELQVVEAPESEAGEEQEE